eukprot:11169058-Lingulodinium_polyedra.AAC.1
MPRFEVIPLSPTGAVASTTVDEPAPSPFAWERVAASTAEMLKNAFAFPAYRSSVESALGIRARDI